MKVFVSLLLVSLSGWSVCLQTSRNEKNTSYSLGSNNNRSDISKGTNASSFAESGVLIVGGTEAKQNEFPWLVNLIIDGSFCGGSLIDMDLVLTAAHCVVDADTGKVIPAKKISVTAGDHNRRRFEPTEQTVTASGVKLHENYNYKRPDSPNDIALVRLSESFTRTNSVNPISLPKTNSSRTECNGVNGIVAGWGFTAEDAGYVSDLLMKVQVPEDISRYCEGLKTDFSGQFCAGEYRKDSCQGDSGGPFMCSNTPSIIRGIVSYGDGCGRQNRPGVYTRVSIFVPWIQKNFNFSSASTVFASYLLLVLSALILTLKRD